MPCRYWRHYSRSRTPQHGPTVGPGLEACDHPRGSTLPTFDAGNEGEIKRARRRDRKKKRARERENFSPYELPTGGHYGASLHGLHEDSIIRNWGRLSYLRGRPSYSNPFDSTLGVDAREIDHQDPSRQSANSCSENRCLLHDPSVLKTPGTKVD